MAKQRERISKKLRRFIRQAVVGALTTAMHMATGKQVSINPAWIQVRVKGGWYSFGFGNPNDPMSFSGAGTVSIRTKYTDIAVNFYSWLMYRGREPFNSKRWLDLHRSRSFVMKRGPNSKLIYTPPQELVVRDRRGRPLDFTSPRVARIPKEEVQKMINFAVFATTNGLVKW